MSGIENSGNGSPKCNQEGTLPVFSHEQTGRVPAHGVGSHGVQKQTPHPQSKLQQILDNIKQPRLSAAEVSRLIAIEIILIIREMRTCESDDDAGALKLKNFIEQIRALRAVAEVAKVADVWSKLDSVRFDAPGFDFVLGEIASYCKEAASTALRGDRVAVNSIMRELHAIIGARRTELRCHCTGEDRQRLEDEPNERWTNEPGNEDGVPAQAMARHNARIDYSEPEIESDAEKNLKHPETSPIVPAASESRTQNGAGDTATEHNNGRNGHSQPENESAADENLQRAKTASSVPLPRNPTTENGAPYTLTPHPDERSDPSEPKDDSLPFEGLIKSEADRTAAKNVLDSIIRHEELE